MGFYIWLHLATFGCIWLHLAAFGNIYLQAFRGQRARQRLQLALLLRRRARHAALLRNSY